MHAASFAEVLQRHLDPPVCPPGSSSATARPITPPLFASVPRLPRRPPVWAWEAPAAADPPARPVLLTAGGRGAIEVLNALGAHLTDSPSRTEVRRAFRALARRYHPDRHTGRNADDLALLARSFAAATDAYRRLIAEIDGCRTH